MRVIATRIRGQKITNIDVTTQGPNTYYRLVYSAAAHRTTVSFDTLEEAVIVRDSLNLTYYPDRPPYSDDPDYLNALEPWNMHDFRWLQRRFRLARLSDRLIHRPDSFGILRPKNPAPITQVNHTQPKPKRSRGYTFPQRPKHPTPTVEV